MQRIPQVNPNAQHGGNMLDSWRQWAWPARPVPRKSCFRKHLKMTALKTATMLKEERFTNWKISEATFRSIRTWRGRSIGPEILRCPLLVSRRRYRRRDTNKGHLSISGPIDRPRHVLIDRKVASDIFQFVNRSSFNIVAVFRAVIFKCFLKQDFLGTGRAGQAHCRHESSMFPPC